MKTHTKCLVILFSIVHISTFAQWNSDTTVNNTISHIENYGQYDPQSTSDGNGGAIIAWVSTRSGSSHDIYVQRINADGYIQWTTNGMPVCTANEIQNQIKIVSDGASGAIITWVDQRNGNRNFDIYAQRINAIGEPLWAANGIVICNAENFQNKPRIIPYLNNGAIISWTDGRNKTPNDDIYTQRIDGNGTIQWAANGVPVCIECIESFNVYSIPQITSNETTHEIFYIWPKFINNESDIYAQKLNSNGVSQWAVSGISICNAPNFQTNPKVISDTNGDIIICWEDNRTGSGDDIYAQRLNSSGDVQWAANGIVVCSAYSYQDNPNIVSDGIGGAYIVWDDERSFVKDIYAQRINASGNQQWLSNGIPICTATGVQAIPDLILTKSSNLVIVWGDNRPSGGTIYAQNISASGNILWATDGIIVTKRGGLQSTLNLVKSDANNVIISWGSNGISYDINVSKLNTNGTLGLKPFNTKLDINLYPNPTKDFLNINNLSNLPIDSIVITDLSGKKVMEQNSGSNTIDVSKLQLGLYIIQLKSIKKTIVTKFIKN